MCELREKAVWPNFWLWIWLPDARISNHSCVNAGSAERNSITNRARKNFATSSGKLRVQRRPVSDPFQSFVRLDHALGDELIQYCGELVFGPLAIAIEFRQALSAQFQEPPAFRGQYQLSGRLLFDVWAGPAFAAMSGEGHGFARRGASWT